MPVEGQWARTRTPLSRRDKLLLLLAGTIAVVAVAVAAIVAGRHGSDSGSGCLTVNVSSTMGGARLRQCGAPAHEFCRTQAPKDEAVARACRAQGFAADLP